MAAAKMARTPPSASEIGELAEELKEASDRAAGVLAAAHLEVEIERFISERMVKLTEGEEGLIFGPQGGFLSPAMAKVRLAHALGFFGAQTRDACVVIFDVRNIFAHSPRTVTFSTSAIKNKCDKLTLPEACVEAGFIKSAEINSTRERYLFSIYIIIVIIGRLRTEHSKSKLLALKSILEKFREHLKGLNRGEKSSESLMEDLSESIEILLTPDKKTLLP